MSDTPIEVEGRSSRMECAMCGLKAEIRAGRPTFEYGGCVWGIGKLEWYDDVIGVPRCLNLCYRCAEKLAEVAKSETTA